MTMDKRQQIYNRLYSRATDSRRSFVFSERHNIDRLRLRLHRFGFHHAARLPDSDVLRITVEAWRLQWRLRIGAETALYLAMRGMQQKRD
jgi:hypothetical protein